MERHEHKQLVRIVVVVLVCVLAGFWVSQTYWSPSPEGVPSSAPVTQLPDFTLPDLDDRHRSIREWQGRSLIINFWATWCAPCRREMPLLQNLHEQRADGSLRVVGVALDDKDDARRFVEQIGVTYPILYGEDAGARAADSFGDSFVGLPFSAFIAPGGEILALRAGEVDADDLDLLVTEMDAVQSGARTPSEARERLAVD